MNPFLSLQQSSLGNLIEPLGWALVHSFWQMLVVAAVATVIVRLMRQGSAQARYAVLLATLAAAVIWPVTTFALLPTGAPLSAPEEPSLPDEGSTKIASPDYSNPISIIEPISPKAHEGEPIHPAALESEQQDSSAASASDALVPLIGSWTEAIQAALRPWLGWLVTTWFLGMVLCSLRPLLGWLTLRRLRRVGVSEVPGEIQAVLNRAARSFGLKRLVKIKQSVLATVPVVVGYLRPTILLPISVLGHMPVAQLEAIIAHELAHVRRHDFLVNLVQTLVETLFFYHPAIWWLSHRIRIEREHCCDDLVVGMLGNRVAYGRALIAIEQLRGQQTLLALGAADGSLLSRIRRIVGSPVAGTGASSWSLPGLVFFGVCAFLVVNLAPWKGATEARAAEAQAEEPPGNSPLVTQAIETLVGDESKWPSALRVTGRIVDADTGKPIERAAFQGGRCLPGQPGKVEWGQSFSYGDRLPNGEFAQTLNWAAYERRRIFAAGYEPASILDELPNSLPSPPVVERIIRLKKGRLVQGRLRNHLGQGVANGQVFFIPEGHKANIVGGVPGLDNHGFHANTVDHSVTQVKTDAEGRFQINVGGTGILAASSEQVDLWPFPAPGEGQTAELMLPQAGQLKIDLAYWYLDDSTKKAKEKGASDDEDPHHCFIHVYRMEGPDNLWKQCRYGGNLLVFADDPKVTLAKGVRVGPIDRSQKPTLIEGKWQNRSLSTQIQVPLPPGHYQIYRFREGERSPQAANIEIKSGEFASLDWTRSEGSAVMGTVALPANSQFVRQEGEAPRNLDWTIPHNGYVLISSKEEKSPAKEWKTLEVARILKDGTFLIPTHLAPGTYQASAWAWLPESDQSRQFNLIQDLSSLVANKEFTVPKPPAEGAAPLRLQLTMESKSNQIVATNQTAPPSVEGAPAAPRELTEDEVAQQVLAILRKPYNPDPTRGSWQGGAFETEMLMKLSLLKPKDLVVKTLMNVVEGKVPSNFQQRRLALVHVAGAAPEKLLPYLIQDLGAKDSKTSNASERLVLMYEVEALTRMGEEARAAIPVIVKKMSDPDWDLSEHAIGALVKIGPQSPEVVKALSARFDRSRAVYEAARFGELAKELGPAFAGLLDADNKEISTWAAFGLVKSGFNPNLGLDFLVKQAEQGKAVPQNLALIALGALGSDATPAIEKLRPLAKDPSESFAREVNRTIDRIEKNDRISTHAEEAAKTAAARKAAREAMAKLEGAQARPRASIPGPEFLASYPKLKELTLSMTEKDFLEIARKQKLKLHMELGNEGSKYLLLMGDGHTLIVMFRNPGEPCTGIQRIRGEQVKKPAQGDGPASGTSNRPNDLRFTGQLRNVRLKDVLQWLANAAALELQIDEDEVKQNGLNLNQLVDMTVNDESPREIFDKVIEWRSQSGIFHEIRGGRLIVSTFARHITSIQEQLPDWLKIHKDELGMRLDENNQITALNPGRTMINDEFLARLATLPKLTELHLGGTARLNPSCLARLANLPQLQVVILSGLKNEGKGLGDEAIKNLIGLKSLRELSISGCGVTDSGIKMLESVGSLQKLTVGEEERLTDEALASIGRMIQLTSLNLESRMTVQERSRRDEEEGRPRSFSEMGLRKLAGLKNLEELNLLGQPVGPEGLSFPKLKSLILGHYTFNNACAARIAQLSELQSLKFYYCPVSDAALKTIAESPSINQLAIISSIVTDAGIDNLKGLKKLQDISLSETKLTDMSLKSLAQIKTLTRIRLSSLTNPAPGLPARKTFTLTGVQQLKMLPELRTLELYNYRFKEGFWGLKEFTQLKELGLYKTSISSEEIEALKESLPNTQIRENPMERVLPSSEKQRK